MKSQVGVKTAALLLGVSPSTLKRLCDINIIPSFRTPGGHRRFDRSTINLAGRQILGELDQPQSSFFGQRWNELFRRGTHCDLNSILEELSVSGGLLSQLDSILRQSNEVLAELIQKHGPSDYRVHLVCQSALSAISWQTSRIKLSKSRCKRAIGFAANLSRESSQADRIGSALISLSLRILDVDELNVSEPANIDTVLDVAKRIGATYVWVACCGDHTSSALEQALNSLKDGLPRDVRLLLFAPHRDLGRSKLDMSGFYTKSIADFVKVVLQDQLEFTSTCLTSTIGKGVGEMARI